MRLPPKLAVDDTSEVSDAASETTSLAEAASLDDSALVINVHPADINEPTAEENLADLVEAQLAHLDIDRRSNTGLETPSTARNLYDATPRASPSPELRQHDEQSSPPLSPDDGNTQQLTSEVTTDMQQLHLDDAPLSYKVRDEPLPTEPFFSKEFQKLIKSGKAMANDVYVSLGTCSLATQSSPELGRVRASANKLRKFESPVTRLIGIVGDSAADIPDLAHKDDHGSAVTSFVTEYHRRSSQHAAPFTIEVEYCNQAEIDDQLHELLVSYRELYQPGLGSELENNEHLYREIEKKSGVAASTLQSIFPDQPEVAPAHLKDEGEGAFDRILNDLKRLASRIKWPSDAANGRWTATASSATECHDKVAFFMQQGLWPLTNVVRIYLSAQVLKTGVVLADLPGYRDINLARVRKAEQYLLRCHEVFIVANINRVISDESVAKFVSDQMKASGRRRSVTIVCTHADDIDIPAAEKKYKSVASSKAGKKFMRASKNAWGPKGSAAAAQVADTKYKYLFVSARNADVKRALQRRYMSSGIGLDVNVFCIGNRDYEGAGYRSQEARQKAIQGSCIPDLRRSCHSIVAQAQYQASVHFLEVELPSLIQSLDVWLSVFDQKASLTVDPQFIRDLQSDLEQKIDDFTEELEDAVLTHVLDSMRQYDGASNEHALNMSEEWTGWHWTSYKAFCRKNGDHCTEAVGRRSWNAELLGGMTPSMTTHWLALQTTLAALDKQLRLSVSTDCNNVREAIKALGVPASVMASFRLKERELSYLSETQALFEEKTDSLRDHVIEMSESIVSQLETFSGPELEAQKRNPGEVEKVREILQSVKAQNQALQRALEGFKKSGSTI
ncbi:MAG: hypothetical protein Q9209_001497 [Squamulea sp. 1 TL-2023]